jgi:hypothetical protein
MHDENWCLNIYFHTLLQNHYMTLTLHLFVSSFLDCDLVHRPQPVPMTEAKYPYCEIVIHNYNWCYFAVPTTSMCRRFGQSHMWLVCTGVLTIL